MCVCVFQESPTGELADFAFSAGTEPSAQTQPDPVLEAPSCETFCSDERDGSIPEDGEFPSNTEPYTS